MSKINQLIKEYENGKNCGSEILDEYYKLTADINRRDQVGNKLYPNLLKFIKRMIK